MAFQVLTNAFAFSELSNIVPAGIPVSGSEVIAGTGRCPPAEVEIEVYPSDSSVAATGLEVRVMSRKTHDSTNARVPAAANPWHVWGKMTPNIVVVNGPPQTKYMDGGYFYLSQQDLAGVKNCTYLIKLGYYDVNRMQVGGTPSKTVYFS